MVNERKIIEGDLRMEGKRIGHINTINTAGLQSIIQEKKLVNEGSTGCHVRNPG